MIFCIKEQRLRWCRFEEFNLTCQFLEKGFRTCQFSTIKSKNTVIWTLTGAERVLNKGIEKIGTLQFKIIAQPLKNIVFLYEYGLKLWQGGLRCHFCSYPSKKWSQKNCEK